MICYETAIWIRQIKNGGHYRTKSFKNEIKISKCKYYVISRERPLCHIPLLINQKPDFLLNVFCTRPTFFCKGDNNKMLVVKILC